MNHAQLTALGRALRVLGEHGDALSADVPDDKLHEIRQDLRRALELLGEGAGPAPTTRCSEHPNGPVDENAADRCLLCETRRRTSRRSAYDNAWPSQQGEADQKLPVPSRYGISTDHPQPQERWRPEAWNGSAWQLCGTPRRDVRETEGYLAASRRAPRPAAAYRLVREFTAFEVVRVWGEPTAARIDPGGIL
ncbi:hypothetical protein [Streptomyces tsukubensis]|uniref:Uncharacterized protein n=1 Tax=Streptomyces tsukubensis TaxID=83656 RepID=A0A1V4AGS8_9ACTN|nr:hypothetical protein [Streptomyces tsukubensis]OON82643.1 hypothetical protein B1H18_00835 [Streptomyces tsukubensis]QFR92186.1 hypothetical protein GBW32_02860 [Streptomyces tsukubensis]